MFSKIFTKNYSLNYRHDFCWKLRTGRGVYSTYKHKIYNELGQPLGSTIDALILLFILRFIIPFTLIIFCAFVLNSHLMRSISVWKIDIITSNYKHNKLIPDIGLWDDHALIIMAFMFTRLARLKRTTFDKTVKTLNLTIKKPNFVFSNTSNANNTALDTRNNRRIKTTCQTSHDENSFWTFLNLDFLKRKWRVIWLDIRCKRNVCIN